MVASKVFSLPFDADVSGLFTIGFQAVVWVIPSEILPLRLRVKGSSVSTAINWILKQVLKHSSICGSCHIDANICSYAVVQVTPIAILKLQWKFYVLFGVLNASFLVPIYFLLPETAGKSLETIDLLFTNSSRRDTLTSDSANT